MLYYNINYSLKLDYISKKKPNSLYKNFYFYKKLKLIFKTEKTFNRDRYLGHQFIETV